MTKNERLRFYESYKDVYVYTLSVYDEAIKAEKDSEIDKMNTYSKARVIIEKICSYIIKQNGFRPEGHTLSRYISCLRDRRILDDNVVEALNIIREAGNDSLHPKLYSTVEYDNKYDTEIILNSLYLCVKWFYEYHLRINRTVNVSRENVVAPIKQDVKVQHSSRNDINSGNSIGTEGIRDHIRGIFQAEKERGKTEVVLVSGDIHKDLNLTSRMPSVCGAMRSLMGSKDKIIYEPPKRNGSRVEIRYYL